MLSVLTCLTMAALVTSISGQTRKTAMVVSLIKYGNTNPDFDYNITRYGNSSFRHQYAEPLALTEVGKRQMFVMGRYYKMRYSSLFSDSILDNDVNVISSDSTRSVTAAHAFMLGFTEQTAKLETDSSDSRLQPRFRRLNRSVSHTDTSFGTSLPPGWNTITIQATSMENDTLLNLNSKDVCPNRNILLAVRAKERLEKFMKDPSLREAIEAVSRVYGIDKTEIDFDNLETCYKLFSLIESDFYRRREPIINRTKTGEFASVYEELERCSDASLVSLYGSYEDIVTAASPLFINITKTITEFVSRDNPVASKESPVKNRIMNLYSCHKKSFLPAMVILGLTSLQCVEDRFKLRSASDSCMEFPNGATHIAIELIKQEEAAADIKPVYFVSVSYQDRPIKLPGMADSLVPLATFLTFIDRVINNQWKEDCGLYLPTQIKRQSSKWLILLIVSNALLLAIIIAAFWFMWRLSGKEKPTEDDDDIISDLNHSINDKTN